PGLLFAYFAILLACVLLSACTSDSEPAEPMRAGNPVLEGWYADPEGIVFGDRYWIYPTYSAKYAEQVFFDAFSSPDLVQWTKHARILDTTAVAWADSAMWAPAAIEKDGKYYFFFAANDIQSNDALGGIGVAVADQPEGPFKDHLGRPLIDTFYNGAQPIDQFVFQDGDDYFIIYGGWRHANIARLNDDFTGLVPFEDGALTREITPEDYVEGPFMFKRNGQYYFMWSEGSWTGDDYRVAYAIADSPFGPFERIGTILEQDPAIATGAGHHSVIQVPGADEWYIVYHRRPIPTQGPNHRVTAIDRMYFNDDGTIQAVQMTDEGVAARLLR
ncbi:MAG TPA: glycoside hydrolase family 43 protein, partial [Rhodothermales bacterium]|nr:glycoside hydrolase family 43 protein [Rhodothermales bacterium]